MSKEQPEALRLADALYEQSEHHFEMAQYCDMRPCDTLNWEHFKTNREAAAELRRLHAENDALRAQIGQGEPRAWLWTNIKTKSSGVYTEDPTRFNARLDDPDYKWTLLYTHPAPQQKPLTDEQQIAEALRKHGFALVKTATGYDVMKLGPCIAHNIGEKK